MHIKRKLLFCFGHKVIFHSLMGKFLLMVLSFCELYELGITPSPTAPAVTDTLYMWLICPLKMQEQFC